MKGFFFIILFFILFFVIQRIPYQFDHKTTGFPLTTYSYWFTTTHINEYSQVTTTHVVNKPKNVYINFVIYTIIIVFLYGFVTKQNVLKLISNNIIEVVKSKWLRKTFELLAYSFIIFAITQFIPYHRNFENNIACNIGFPNVAYYVYDAQCYRDTFFEPVLFIVNFVAITILTFSLYFIIQFVKTIYNKLQTIKNQ